MKNNTILITTASWEPRFILGAERIFGGNEIQSCLCFWFEEFGDRTLDARNSLEDKAQDVNCEFVSLLMYSAEVSESGRKIPAFATNWKRIKTALDKARLNADSFVLDITTMPREALLIVLDLLTEAGLAGKILYHRATGYGEWCSSEPDRPHIVPKLGGLPSLKYSTRLMIISGYDEDRSEQFVASYEPSGTMILFQEFTKGANLENESKNEMKHKLRFQNRNEGIEMAGVNCYNDDWGFSEIYTVAKNFGKDANLILASLGPKTSAVSLYRVHRNLEQSSLVYAPCKNYSEHYSFGIEATLSLDWNPKELLV